MASTALELITESYVELGVLAGSQSPSATLAATGLSRLNALLGTLNVDRLGIFATRREVFPITAADGEYTIGSGGNFDTVRPVAIKAASVVAANGVTTPQNILSDEMWAAIKQKTASAPVSENLYYDAAYPLATIRLHPVPSAVGSTLELYSRQQLSTFAAVEDAFDMPPGYERMLVHLLAVDLAPTVGREVSQATVAKANDARATLGGLNLPPVPGAAQEAAAKRQSSGQPQG